MLRLAAPAFVLLLASPAYAAVIDFTDASWEAADGSTSYSTTVGGVGVTVTSSPTGSTIEHTSFGVGVDYLDTSEENKRQIEGVEVLTLDFDTLVDITSLTMNNLYQWGGLRIEVGNYTIDSNTTGVQGEHAGSVTADVDADPTTTITFYAPTGSFPQGPNGFALGSLSFDIVGTPTAPELDPNVGSGALALMIGGTLLLSERRKRAA